MEIERLELANATAREDVKGKESSEAALTHARSSAVAALEAQASHLESHADEAAANVQRIMSEMRSIFPVVEVLFNSLGCDSALAPRAKASAGLMSPLSKQTASLAMYASPALIEAVKEGGVTASSVPHFMGMLENRGADVIQTYAAMVTNGSLSAGADAGAEEAEVVARKAEADEIKLQQAVELAAAGALAEGEAAGAAAAPPPPPPGETVRRFISSSALGPSLPTGRLKESLTTSMLVAAMSMPASAGGAAAPAGAAAGAAGGAGATAGRARGRAEPASHRHAGGGDDEPEEDSGGAPRPYSIDELKAQASAQLRSDESVKAISSAAAVAASILGRHLS